MAIFEQALQQVDAVCKTLISENKLRFEQIAEVKAIFTENKESFVTFYEGCLKDAKVAINKETEEVDELGLLIMTISVCIENIAIVCNNLEAENDNNDIS